MINGTCGPCEKGFWKTDNDSALFCSPCPIGRTTTEPRSPYEVNCTIECAVNTFFNATSGNCSSCPSGRFSFFGAGACCEAGEYNSKDPNDLECLGCPAGTYSSAATSYACWPCPAGRFTNSTNNTACSLCPAGTDSVYGGANCTLCKQGMIVLEFFSAGVVSVN